MITYICRSGANRTRGSFRPTRWSLRMDSFSKMKTTSSRCRDIFGVRFISRGGEEFAAPETSSSIALVISQATPPEKEVLLHRSVHWVSDARPRARRKRPGPADCSPMAAIAWPCMRTLASRASAPKGSCPLDFPVHQFHAAIYRCDLRITFQFGAGHRRPSLGQSANLCRLHLL